MTELTIESSSYVLIVHKSKNASRKLKRKQSSITIEADEDMLVDAGKDIKYCDYCFDEKSEQKI